MHFNRFFIIVFFLVSCLLLLASNYCFAKKQDEENHLLNYRAGVKLHLENNLSNAVYSLNNALTLKPYDIPSLVELGVVFSELSKPALSIPAFLKAVNFAPDDALIHLFLGRAYIQNKQYKEALVQFKQAVKLNPENTLLKANIGETCFYLGEYQCAIDNLKEVLVTYPNELRARVILGNSYHFLKNYPLAEENYKLALEWMPLNKLLTYNLSKIQIALGKLHQSKSTIDNAILLDDKNIEFYLDRANINYKLNNLKSAEEDYLKAFELDNYNPETLIEYAIFLGQTGEYLKSAEQFSKALELEPDNLDLLINKAYVLQLAKHDNEASLIWKDILEKDGYNKIALFNLARLYQEKEEYDSAIDLYKKLISIENENEKRDVNNNDVKFALAYCLQKNKNFNDAKSVYKEIVDDNSKDSNSLYNLGIIYQEEGDYKEAVKYFEKTVESNFLNPELVFGALISAYTELNDSQNIDAVYRKWLERGKNNVEIRVAYAKYLATKGDSERAIEQYRVAAALDDTSKSRYKLARFLLEQNDRYGAIGQLQEYLKFEPNDVNALILLANSFKDLEIYEQAINVYKKIISIQSDNYLAYYNLGLLYEQNKKHEEAQNYLLKSIEINEKYSPAYYALGLSFLAVNNPDKAKELFEQYLQLDPNGEYKDKIEVKLKELLTKPDSGKNEKQAV